MGSRPTKQILFFGISLTALLLAVLINRRLIRVLLTPLTALTSASLNTKQQIKAGESDGDNAAPLSYSCSLSGSSTREVLDLNQAIESMVEGFNRLTRTIRQKDEQALATMASKLKVSLEAASIAHEIKQPLSVVRLTSQSLNQLLNRPNTPALPPALSEGLSTLDQETERINTITEKMRALLRNAQIKREPVDLLQVMESSMRYVTSNRGQNNWIDGQSLEPMDRRRCRHSRRCHSVATGLDQCLTTPLTPWNWINPAKKATKRLRSACHCKVNKSNGSLPLMTTAQGSQQRPSQI